MPSDVQDFDPIQPRKEELQQLVTLYASGDLGRAEEMARTLADAYPETAVIFNIYGAILAGQGRFDEAIERYTRAIALKDDYPEAYSNLGVAYRASGDLGKAIECQKKAIGIDPDYAGAHSNLAAALHGKGDLEEAVESYRAGLEREPDFLEDYINLGIALSDLERREEAAEAFRQAIARKEDFVEAHYNLGNVLHEMGESHDAIESYLRAIELNPKHAAAHNNMGNAYKAIARFNEAVECYKAALEANPDHANAHDNMGNTYMELGRMDEAMASYRKAIALQPASGENHRHLANARKHETEDDEVRQALELFEHPNCPGVEKMHLAFALGKIYEDLKEYDRAFDYYQQGNKLKRVTFGYSSADVSDYFASLRDIMTPEFLDQRRRGKNGGAAPIFILGMPRSGTSLIEQMIASHPKVTGAGELDDLPLLIQREIDLTSAELPEGLAELDKDALERIAKGYQDRIKGLASGTPHVTDKTPHNFLNVGLIRAILPSARIIHMRRDPLDTCFSIYATYFSAPHYYAWDLEELGKYYRDYEALMQHWREVDAQAMCDVDYETLIAKPKEEITRVLEWCGLEFDEACLDYAKNKRPVRTASAAQVRQPIYTSSVKRWRNFEEHLAPLKRVLEG